MKILIATDGSKHGDAAVDTGTRRPWPPDSEFRVLIVMERPAISYVSGGEYEFDLSYNQIAADLRKSLEEIVDQAAEKLQKAGFTTTRAVREGVVAEEIINEAQEWDADLILIGTHGRSGISRFLLGSVAQRVASHAPCSVEIVRKSSE